MGMQWTIRILSSDVPLAATEIRMELNHTPRRDEALIIPLRQQQGGWRSSSCRVETVVNTAREQTIAVHVLTEAAPAVA